MVAGCIGALLSFSLGVSPTRSGRLSPSRARAALGCGPVLVGAPTLDDAITRGRVVVWQSEGVHSPGAVGAGWRSDEASSHVDPETIVLVGTSHVVGVAQSAALVREVIMTAQPDAVVVELCRSRRGLLYAAPPKPAAVARGPNPFGVSGANTEARLAAVGRTLELGGATSLVLRLLLARAATVVMRAEAPAGGAIAEAAAAVGTTAAYSDFVAAREAAELVNATLVLGDRPIEITLERAWNAMRAAERGVFLAACLRIALGLQTQQGPAAAASAPAAVEREAQLSAGPDGPDAAAQRAGGVDIERMAELLVERCPGLHACLVRERDVYLSLTAKSSRAVSGKRCVVAVVGAGHVDGVVRALDEEHRGEFKALTWTPRRARAKVRVLGVLPAPLFDRLLTDGALALGLYAVVQLCS